MSRRRISENVALLFDFATAKPDGFTQPEAAAYLDVDERQMPRFINALRHEFADGDINLVCEPNGKGEKWLYRLVGRPEDARIWHTNRIGDTESRLETMQSVAHSMVGATDGRTIEGRKARVIDRQLTRLIEDLAVIREDIA